MPEQTKLFIWNNQNLFSNNYLEYRLPETDLWKAQKEKAAAAFEEIRKAYESIRALNLGPGEEASLEEKFIRPVLRVLGFELDIQPTTKRGTKKKRPDYALFKDDESYRAARKFKDNPDQFFSLSLTILEAKYWRRRLNDTDKKDVLDSRDPTAQTIKYLDSVNLHTGGKINFAILTNGKQWRLFYNRAASRSGNYFEIDLEEIIKRDDTDKFLYFYLFFSKDAFVPDPVTGNTWLDQHLKGTEDYASRVSIKLKNLIFDQVFEGLTSGFIYFGKTELALPYETDKSRRDIFKGCLTLLYRLLFILYAESRNLLPVGEDGYYKVSLTKLKKDISQDLKTLGHGKMSKRSYVYWARLHGLFDIISKGDPALNVPVYNGGLFETPKDSFLSIHKLPDPFLADAIELLTVDHEGIHAPDAPAFIDYSSLSVRHLGDIYEGILEFHIQVAEEDVVEIRKDGKYLWEKASAIKEGIRVYGKRTKGEVYIENSKHERKATGSFYTPHFSVEYIVGNTVGPVLDEKLKIADGLLSQFAGMQKKSLNNQLSADSIRGYKAKIRELEDEIFKTVFGIKVLDPAMGSGHFLVHTVDYISDRIIAFLAGYPDNPVIKKIAALRNEILEEISKQGVKIDESKLTEVNLIKRMVMKRCIYGVDLNEMAVELAKLSLWLDSFTLGAPLSFLDHHLKCGNSLIGTNIDALEKALTGRLFAINLEPLKRAIRDMIFVSDLPDATVEQVRESYKKFGEANKGLEGYRILLDMLVAEHFGIPDAKKMLVSDFDKIDLNNLHASIAKLPDKDRKLIEKVEAITGEKRFFHWEIEFPEVFYEQKEGFEQKVERKENPGFDCVIGNPPYINIMLIEDEDLNYLTESFVTTRRRFDLFVIFTERAIHLLKKEGYHSFIVPDKILSETYGTNLRKLMLAEHKICSIFDVTEMKVFPDAAVKPIVYVLKNEETNISEITVEVPINEEATEIKEWTIPQQDFLDIPEFRIRLDWTIDTKKIVEKINNSSFPLSRILYTSWGAQPGEADKFFFYGKEPNCGNDSNKCKANECPSKKGACKPLIKGGSISRYSIYYDDAHILYDITKLHRPAFPELFENKKIVVREVSGEKGLISAYDDDNYYTDHSLINCIPKHYLETLDERTLRDRGIKFVDFQRAGKDNENKVYDRDTVIYPEDLVDSKNYRLKFIIALINSSLIGFYYKKYVSGELNVFPEHVRTLPIPAISFTTPVKERKKFLKEAVKLYERSKYEDIIKWADYELALKRTDTSHDFLAYLAEQMIGMNKEKQKETKDFLAWLKDVHGINKDNLKPKTYLDRFYGLKVEDFFRHLEKNKIKPSPKDYSQIRKAFEDAKSKIVPVIEKIQTTDNLIDQIVYRLYGLTEEEIGIVKGAKN